jgi:hypothetical protein
VSHIDNQIKIKNKKIYLKDVKDFQMNRNMRDWVSLGTGSKRTRKASNENDPQTDRSNLYDNS